MKTTRSKKSFFSNYCVSVCMWVLPPLSNSRPIPAQVSAPFMHSVENCIQCLPYWPTSQLAKKSGFRLVCDYYRKLPPKFPCPLFPAFASGFNSLLIFLKHLPFFFSCVVFLFLVCIVFLYILAIPFPPWTKLSTTPHIAGERLDQNVLDWYFCLVDRCTYDSHAVKYNNYFEINFSCVFYLGLTNVHSTTLYSS